MIDAKTTRQYRSEIKTAELSNIGGVNCVQIEKKSKQQTVRRKVTNKLCASFFIVKT